MTGLAGIGRKMKLIVAICVVSVLLVGPANGVETKLDKINVDKYLENTQLVEEHMRCLIYSGLFLTYRYSGISTTRCRVCTPEQEQKLGKIAQHWQQNYPMAWRDLTRIIAG